MPVSRSAEFYAPKLNSPLRADVNASLAVFAFAGKGRAVFTHYNGGYRTNLFTDAAAVTVRAYTVEPMKDANAQRKERRDESGDGAEWIYTVFPPFNDTEGGLFGRFFLH
jgi:hypothetical protein